MEPPESLRRALQRRYIIRRELGRGGTAVVYLAQDLKHDREVAVKVLRPEIAVALGPERFIREIKVAAALRHPHVVPLLDSGEADGWLYYVMPCVEGETLRRLLEREGALPVDDAIRIAKQICEVLGHAHSKGIVHRDIKPENILVSGDHCLVADFGIAQALTLAGAERLTETGVAVGTPAYMSPEQVGATVLVDARADVYATACVLYEMLAGSVPFTGPTAQAVMARHALDPVPPLRTVRRSVPAHVERALLRALEKVPADRYGSMAQFADALDAPAGGERRPSWATAAAAVLALSLLLAVARAVQRATQLDSPAARRVAVLPLENLSRDPEADVFVDGMHDALIAELARIESISPISRTTMLRYRDTDKSIPEIARELSVDAIVEGSVLIAGDSMRLTAQVIDSADHPLWTRVSVGQRRDVLRLYGELAADIADRIGTAVPAAGRERLARAPRVDPEVFRLAFGGHSLCQQWTEESLREGILWLRNAIDRDPSYAAAYSRLAMCYADLAFFGFAAPSEVHPRASAAAERALELDPALGEAYATRGWIRFVIDVDFEGPRRDFERALDLSPNSTPVAIWYADYLTLAGHFDEAIAMRKRAMQLDPLSTTTSLSLGWTYFKARRYDDAIGALRGTLELDPGYWFAHAELGWSYSEKGMYDAAAAQCDSAFVSSPQDDDVALMSSCGWVYGRTGRRSQAEQILRRFEEMSQRRWLSPFYVAAVYVGLADADRAIDLLQRAAEEGSPGLVFLKVDPTFDPIRTDPRFRALLHDLHMEPA